MENGSLCIREEITKADLKKKAFLINLKELSCIDVFFFNLC